MNKETKEQCYVNTYQMLQKKDYVKDLQFPKDEDRINYEFSFHTDYSKIIFLLRSDIDLLKITSITQLPGKSDEDLVELSSQIQENLINISCIGYGETLKAEYNIGLNDITENEAKSKVETGLNEFIDFLLNKWEPVVKDNNAQTIETKKDSAGSDLNSDGIKEENIIDSVKNSLTTKLHGCAIPYEDKTHFLETSFQNEIFRVTVKEHLITGSLKVTTSINKRKIFDVIKKHSIDGKVINNGFIVQKKYNFEEHMDIDCVAFFEEILNMKETIINEASDTENSLADVDDFLNEVDNNESTMANRPATPTEEITTLANPNVSIIKEEPESFDNNHFQNEENKDIYNEMNQLFDKRMKQFAY